MEPFDCSCLCDRCNCQARKEAGGEICANYDMYKFLYQHNLNAEQEV